MSLEEASLAVSGTQEGASSAIKNDSTVKKGIKDGSWSHEMEILPGQCPEAAESSYAWNHCTKNPGHETFISASKFNEEHLPPAARTQENLEFIKDFSDRTVRLRVTSTSEERPDNDPFAHVRSFPLPRYGSGFAVHASKGEGFCKCHACACSSSPSQKWYKIQIRTARHVVYNNEEVESTSVDFFYDDTDSELKGKVKTLFGFGSPVLDRDDDKCDNCTFTCITHDKELAEWLVEATQKYSYGGSSDTSDDYTELHDKNTVVIVSHPHGKAKHTTVGDMARQMKEHQYKYTTDTCSGSSGAPMLVIGPLFPVFIDPLPHSGSTEGEMYNHSASERWNFRRKLFNLLGGLGGNNNHAKRNQQDSDSQCSSITNNKQKNSESKHDLNLEDEQLVTLRVDRRAYRSSKERRFGTYIRTPFDHLGSLGNNINRERYQHDSDSKYSSITKEEEKNSNYDLNSDDEQSVMLRIDIHTHRYPKERRCGTYIRSLDDFRLQR